VLTNTLTKTMTKTMTIIVCTDNIHVTQPVSTYLWQRSKDAYSSRKVSSTLGVVAVVEVVLVTKHAGGQREADISKGIGPRHDVNWPKQCQWASRGL
jgi:hypothetical protein